jgi:peptide/nickel transport system substrate-binding protein
MKKLLIALSMVFVLALLLVQTASVSLAQEITCESEVTVQADDWLSKLADKFYGDPLAFPAIVAATSAQAGADDSFAILNNPDVIEVGWKLCIPATSDAEALLAGSFTTDQPSGTVVVALASAPVSLDPADHRSRESETVIRNMFDGLVTRDNESGVHMELAEEMNWLDGATLEVKLRQGVRFHNGQEMTADDVVFTFNRVIQENAIEYPEPHTSPRKGLIAPLESVEKVDDYTVRFNFSSTWPAAMQMLVHQQIVPKAYIEEVGTQGFVENPVGTGPFKFVEGQIDDQIVLERFDEYWGGAPDMPPIGPAQVEKVVFRIIPEASTRVAALLAGEADIIQAVPPELITTLGLSEGVEVKTAAGTQPMWLQLDVANPLFSDVKVRQAMNYAVDKELIIDAIYGGRAVALPGPLSPYNNFVNKSLSPYPYDPAKAAELLAEAGWADSDGDGILDKDGQPFAFTIDTIEAWRPLAEALAGLYREAGIDAGVRFWDYSVLRPQLLACERQAFLDDWGDSAFDPIGHFEAKWHTFIEGEPYGRGNFMCYSNPRVDELIKAGEIEADLVQRQTIYDEAQQLVYDEAPAVFLILPEVAEANNVRVSNWQPASDSRINLHDVTVQ